MHLANFFAALGTSLTLTFPHVFVSQNELKIDTSSAFHTSESNIIVKTKGQDVSVTITTNGETVDISYPENNVLSPTIELSPTPLTISPSPTPSIAPTVSPSPTPATDIHSPSPTPVDEVQKYIMDAINEYRVSKGLSEVHTDPYTCSFAKTRAQEIATDFTHDGFENRIKKNTLPYPTYSLITENIAMNPNYKNVVNKWIGSPGHEKNLRADTPYVCVEKNDNFYVFEGWKV